MSAKTPAQRANINARAHIGKLSTLPKLRRVLADELGDHPVEFGTMLSAIYVAQAIGRIEGQKEMLS